MPKNRKRKTYFWLTLKILKRIDSNYNYFYIQILLKQIKTLVNKKIIKILIFSLLFFPFILFKWKWFSWVPNIFILLILCFFCFFEGALLKIYFLQIRAKNIKKGNKRALLFIAFIIFFMYLWSIENYPATGYKLFYIILFILGPILNYNEEIKIQNTNGDLIEK